MTAEDAACSVILTTHSMEEAEALCSRIGVSKCTFFAAVLFPSSFRNWCQSKLIIIIDMINNCAVHLKKILALIFSQW